MAEIFEDAKERLKSRLRSCSVCGASEPDVQITSYYKKNYCQEHLEEAKARRSKKGVKLDAEKVAAELADRLIPELGENLVRKISDAVEQALGKRGSPWQSAEEIKNVFVAVASQNENLRDKLGELASGNILPAPSEEGERLRRLEDSVQEVLSLVRGGLPDGITRIKRPRPSKTIRPNLPFIPELKKRLKSGTGEDGLFDFGAVLEPMSQEELDEMTFDDEELRKREEVAIKRSQARLEKETAPAEVPEEVRKDLKLIYEKVDKLSENMRIGVTSVTSFALDKGSILRIVFNGKHTLPSRLTQIYGKSSEARITDLLEEMSKDHNITTGSGEYVGKLLWRNGHGWYTLNPNVPKIDFERLTGLSLTDELYLEGVRVIFDRATKGKDDQRFREWSGANRKDKKGKWIFVPVRRELLERLRKLKPPSA